jgi:hypothetical protein
MDGVEDPMEKSPQNEPLFYPWGLLGQGYVVADSQTRRSLLLLRRWCGVVLCALLASFWRVRTWTAAEECSAVRST